MKIQNVTAHTLRARLQHPFRFSQWSYDHRAACVVSVEIEGGIVGWGEAYGPASTVATAVRDFFGPLITGRDARAHEALWHFLFARSLDHGQKGALVAAISALDIALWDARAQAAGVPLYRLLGGAHTESIPGYATGFYFNETEVTAQARRFAAEAELYLSRGFRAVKMKVGQGVAYDAALVGAVRSAIGPDTRLMIDANHAYDSTAAIALGRQVEKHDISWFEEPVSPLDVAGYADVRRALAIPIAGGECEYTRFGFAPLFERRALDYAQPDLCGCGGITEGLKIATLASVAAIHVTPHVWGTSIGQAAAAHFYAARPAHPGTLTAEDKWIECDQSENPLRTSLAREPVRVENGRLYLPQTPGLGIHIEEEALRRFSAAGD